MSSQVVLIVLTTFIILVVIIQLLLLIKLMKKTKSWEINEEKTNIQLIDEQLKEEIRITILLKMFVIRNAVQKQTLNIHVKAMENAPHIIGISEEILIKAFSGQEIKLIKQFWNVFQQYVNNYWLTYNGQQFKTVFSGDVGKKTGDVGKMIVASEQLILKLDKLLEIFQEETKVN